MKPSNKGPMLDCYVTGVRKRVSLPDAVRLFWTAAYAWCLKTDKYRWSVNGHAGEMIVSARVRTGVRQFALRAHTRGMRALTLEDFEQKENREFTTNNFQALAARFGEAFDGLPTNLRPFRFCEIGEPVMRARKAYRMIDERPWIVILGVANGTDDDIDWSPFVAPPD